MGQVDLTRLKNCMCRAEKGEELTIGFFGGSITQGCAVAEHKRWLWWISVSMTKRGRRRFFQETYEGVIRRILGLDGDDAVWKLDQITQALLQMAE